MEGLDDDGVLCDGKGEEREAVAGDVSPTDSNGYHFSRLDGGYTWVGPGGGVEYLLDVELGEDFEKKEVGIVALKGVSVRPA